MSKITIEHAKEGGRSKAKASESVLPDTPTLRSPFDVLKTGYKRDDLPKTTRTDKGHGKVLVEFPPNWRDKGKPADSSLARDIKLSIKTGLGDHELDPRVMERLNALPRHRHGSSR